MITAVAKPFVPFTKTDAALVSPGEAVVIGDSQTVGLDHSGVFDRLGTPTHGVSGRSIEGTRAWIENHPESVRGRALIYLQVGGNDLGSGVEAMQRNYLRLLQTVHRLAPDARVVLGTVPVRGEWFDTRNGGARLERTLNGINQWILTAGGGPGDFTAFDVNPLIADPSSPRDRIDRFERSGRPDVHLNRRGYVTVADAFARRFLTP